MTIKCLAYHLEFIYSSWYKNMRRFHPMEVLQYKIEEKPIKIVISYIDENQKLSIIEQDPEKDKLPEFELINKPGTKVNFNNDGYSITTTNE